MLKKSAYVTVLLLLLISPLASSQTYQDIRILTQHFNRSGGDISPWMFIPPENVKEISTTEHPGLLTIWQAGKGQDIKGILNDPIKINDYRLPWDFKMGLLQNYMAMLGVGSKHQMNYAIGLNITVTFSDPCQWPKDRTKRPPMTHDFQLLVVHIGSTSEFEIGLPQFTKTGGPEDYLLWGRGDLSDDPLCIGEWQITNTVGLTGALHYSPLSQQIYFRCTLNSPTTISVGFKNDESQDFVMRSIDCSRFGKITGIWEIGPIFSCDRWIPDVLCGKLIPKRDVSADRGPDPNKNNPTPVPPSPVHEFYVDYCAFMSGYPAPLEELSDDYDIRGYMGNMRGVQIPYAETWSHPGYLTLTLMGPSQGAWWGSNGAYNMNLNTYPPPWEIETCFIAPDNNVPWNMYLIMAAVGKNGKKVTWQPGIQNYPSQKRHRFVNTPFKESSFDIHFKPGELWTPVNWTFEVPESILAHKPLYWLIQMVDTSHVRMGFRKSPAEPWHLSKVWNLSEYLDDAEVAVFDTHCWGTVTGRHFKLPPGSPMYQQFLIDYVHYRYGLSAK